MSGQVSRPYEGKVHKLRAVCKDLDKSQTPKRGKWTISQQRIRVAFCCPAPRRYKRKVDKLEAVCQDNFWTKLEAVCCACKSNSSVDDQCQTSDNPSGN